VKSRFVLCVRRCGEGSALRDGRRFAVRWLPSARCDWKIRASATELPQIGREIWHAGPFKSAERVTTDYDKSSEIEEETE